ncbi:hypothetical protein D3C76_608430 [compost metagenome]
MGLVETCQGTADTGLPQVQARGFGQAHGQALGPVHLQQVRGTCLVEYFALCPGTEGWEIPCERVAIRCLQLRLRHVAAQHVQGVQEQRRGRLTVDHYPAQHRFVVAAALQGTLQRKAIHAGGAIGQSLQKLCVIPVQRLFMSEDPRPGLTTLQRRLNSLSRAGSQAPAAIAAAFQGIVLFLKLQPGAPLCLVKAIRTGCQHRRCFVLEGLQVAVP